MLPFDFYAQYLPLIFFKGVASVTKQTLNFCWEPKSVSHSRENAILFVVHYRKDGMLSFKSECVIWVVKHSKRLVYSVVEIISA